MSKARSLNPLPTLSLSFRHNQFQFLDLYNYENFQIIFFIIKSFSLFSSLSVLSFRCLEWQIISNHSYLLSIIKSLFYKNQDLSNRFHFPFFSLFPVSSFKVDYFQICEGHLLWIWQRGLRLNSWETFTICLFIWSSYQF